mmetsp:Transcript_11457/g.53251  ORF Transcript_11457/g.53251 Transcript_11457/m.53251 type:complete len:458 (-) Transcript_11457:430-1803(-)
MTLLENCTPSHSSTSGGARNSPSAAWYPAGSTRPISQCGASSHAFIVTSPPPAPRPSVAADKDLPSRIARAVANASTCSNGMMGSALLYMNMAGHQSRPRSPGRSSHRFRWILALVLAPSSLASLSACSFLSALAKATSAAFPCLLRASPLHLLPVTAGNPPHAASMYRSLLAMGGHASMAAAVCCSVTAPADTAGAVRSSLMTSGAALPSSTASKDAATMPGSSSPGALSTTSATTFWVKSRASLGSGANPSLRLSAVDTSPRGVSVSATKPVCACMTLPAKRYPPLLKMWRTTPSEASETASGVVSSGTESSSKSTVRSAIRALALATLSSADAAKASPSAGKSVAAAGGMTHTTLSYPISAYILAYLRRCERLHPNHPTSTGSASRVDGVRESASASPRARVPSTPSGRTTRASSTYGPRVSYSIVVGGGGNSAAAEVEKRRVPTSAVARDCCR